MNTDLTETLPFVCARYPISRSTLFDTVHSQIAEWITSTFAIFIALISLHLNLVFIETLRELKRKHLNHEPSLN